MAGEELFFIFKGEIMKYTVEGFSQEKLFEMGLDCTDAVILRWIVDFSASKSIKKITRNAQIYYWISYTHLIKDLPITGINNRDVMGRRIHKLAAAGIIDIWLDKDGGNRTYVAFGDKYETLLHPGYLLQGIGPTYSGVATLPTQESVYPNTKIKDHDSSKLTEKPKFDDDSQPYKLAILLRDEHAKNDREYLHLKAWPSTLQNWASDIDLLIRKDKRPYEQVAAVIRWCQSDDFWQSNILSGKKLRDKYPQLYSRMTGVKKAAGPTTQLSEDDREYLREIQRRKE